ncbi:MAG: TetR/AcrR family transcriptional regulator [Gammaproteobacteria bacterium]|nr:TetR/AcrR family transcriptional regulator [Gammaproteobacteria bacterium]NNJ96188.1 TetR/AcrR family transcriptional regulator [Gammaproteobacteria bacterium]
MSAQADQLPRKQREILQREQLILDTAQAMIHEHGYAQLTMERIAEAVEYSKGTIYNHFSSKEDLVCSLCCRCVNNLIALFKRASGFPGTTRERFSAIGIAYCLYHHLNPLDTQNILIVKTNAVRDKLSAEKVQELNALEHTIIQLCMDLVGDAIEAGDIPSVDTQTADTIVFGFWSQLYGGMLLAQSDIPLDQLGFHPGITMLWNNSQRLLDAYGWQPLSTITDTDALFTRLCSALFSEEVCKLTQEENHHG